MVLDINKRFIVDTTVIQFFLSQSESFSYIRNGAIILIQTLLKIPSVNKAHVVAKILATHVKPFFEVLIRLACAKYFRF